MKKFFCRQNNEASRQESKEEESGEKKKDRSGEQTRAVSVTDLGRGGQRRCEEEEVESR